MALAQTRPGPSVRPVMVHGASATTQFMRAATGTADPTQQQQGRAVCPRTPVDKNILAPGLEGARPSDPAESQCARARSDTTRAARALRPRASALGPAAIQIQGGSPVSSTYPNRSVRALLSSLFPSCHCLRALLLFALLLTSIEMSHNFLSLKLGCYSHAELRRNVLAFSGLEK